MEATSFEDIMKGAVPMGQNPDWAALNATPVPAPNHGGWLGHIVPGVAFISLGVWWLLGVARAYAAASPRAPYRARAWHPLPGRLAGLPLEPLLKLFACFIGINGELWFGHESWRTLTRPDGYLWITHLAEWQHTAMYCAFALSAAVDLTAFYAPDILPDGAPHAALAGAFFLEAGLFAFHLEGTAFDVRAHTLLTCLITTCAILTTAEAAWPTTPILGVARSHATIMQGIWFCTLARVLFEGRRAYDPRYHGGYMFLPALLSFWAIGVGVVAFAIFVAAGVAKRRARPAYGALGVDEDAPSPVREKTELARLA